MRPIFFALQVILVLAMADSAIARTAVQKLLGDWVTARHALTNGSFSCQAVQCANGACSSKRYFLLATSKELSYVVPEFNHGIKPPNGSSVKLIIGEKSFVLKNKSGDQAKFFEPANVKEARKINALLMQLAKSKGSRSYYVIDTAGKKRKFSARRADEALELLGELCGTQVP